MTRDTLVLIPARGGSKGIPRKNLATVGGESLVARAILAAKAASAVVRIAVTTDDPEIGAVASDVGAEVVLRPADLSTDGSSSETALIHALEVLEQAGRLPDITVMVQCTSPFVDGADIDGVVSLVRTGGADCAFTATPSHGFLWTDRGGELRAVNHDPSVRMMRQERLPELLETGAAYAWRTQAFRSQRHRFFGRAMAYQVPRSRSLEIDTPEDLDLARAIASVLRPPKLPRAVSAVAFDFDGVFTDNTVVVRADGSESVRCSRADGLGIALLRARGVPVIVLSTESHGVVTARCGKLGVPVRQGLTDKRRALIEWAAEVDVPLSDVAFVGNDLNDLEALAAAGVAVAVADADPAVVAVADVVLRRPGGSGAVREMCDLVLRDVKSGSPDD